MSFESYDPGNLAEHPSTEQLAGTDLEKDEGVRELEGYAVGDPVKIQGFDGIYQIRKIDAERREAYVTEAGDMEEEEPTIVPIDRLVKM